MIYDTLPIENDGFSMATLNNQRIMIISNSHSSFPHGVFVALLAAPEVVN
jgi:hypothetical protein